MVGIGGRSLVNLPALESLLRTRLDPPDAPGGAARSDRDLNPDWARGEGPLKPAAVLAPIIMRPAGWTMLFTERSVETPAHPGQISFPGGRVQEGDAGPLETALRETREEIGLGAEVIEPLGAFDAYETGTGFRIIPIVALVRPEFSLRLDPREVASVFEAPLSFLFDPANHQRRTGIWRGVERAYYAMPYGEHFIWGATAGMVRALYERLYD